MSNANAATEWDHGGLVIKAIKASKEKIDRVVLHPVQPWIAFADRTGAVTIWNYDCNAEIYSNQMGGSDDGALQEAALRLRADRTAAAIAGNAPLTAATPAQDASLAAKSTASGAVHDLAFLDVDSIFWQLSTQGALQHGACDASAVPSLSRVPGVTGRRWIVAACENKVTLHDLASSQSMDISRSAAFESKSPTRIAFLLLNAPSLVGAVVASSSSASAASAAQLLPVMAVGTSAGTIYLTSFTSAAVFAKLTGGHKGAITSLLPLAAADSPSGADRLLSASADGSVAIWDPSRTAIKGSDRELMPVRTFKAHDSGVRDASFFLTYDFSQAQHRRGGGHLFAHAKQAAAAVGGAVGAAAEAVKKDIVGATGGAGNVAGPGADAKPTTTATTTTTQAAAAAPRLVFRLATVGDDRRLAIWDVSSWNELSRLQPFPKATKASCHSLGFAPWGGAGLGSRPSLVMASGESSAMLGLMPSTGQFTSLIDFAGMIDPGTKKVPKTYHMAVHPTRPHLVAAATNTGVVLLTGDPGERPPVVALPAQVLTLEAMMAQSAAAEAQQQQQQQQEEDKAGGGAGAGGSTQPAPRAAQGLTYVLASGGKLWSTAYRMESRVSPSSVRTVSLEANPREALADLDHPGRPTLACSATGRSVSAVWPDLHAYTIYTLAPTGTWEVADRGTGDCIVWASTAPMYAVISVPNAPAAAAPTQRKGLIGGALNALEAIGIGSRTNQQDAAPSNASAAGGAAPQPQPQAGDANTTNPPPQEAPQQNLVHAVPAGTVHVHVIDETSASQFVAAHDINLNGAHPVRLHGGALLGIVALDPVALQRSLRFFSWRDFSPVGPPLAEPRWVAWEPECTLAALGYDRTVELCRVHPTFQRFATLALPNTQAGLWQSRQLFVTGADAVHLVFADPAQEFVQEIALASIAGGVASKTAPPADATPFPAEQLRPAGPVTLAGVRHSYVWLADAFGRPFLISLRHPGLRLRCLAARGELTSARTIAERGLSAAFHDDVARFLAAMSPGDGVKEALLLPGLSPATELALSVRAGDWDRGARAFQALALGVADRGLLSLATSDASGDAGAVSGAAGTSSMGLAGLPTTPDRAAAVDAILAHHQRTGVDVGSSDTKQKTSVSKSSKSTSAANDAGDGDNDGDEGVVVEEDVVDWDAPLRSFNNLTSTIATSETTTTTTTTAAAAAAVAAVAAVVDPSEQQRVCRATEVGLRFADAAADAGYEDAARAALGALVRFVPILPASLLRDLVSRMGRCRMTESARNVAAAAAAARPGSALQAPSVAALLAALTGGSQREAVQGTLHAAGLAPLSSVFAAAWGVGGADAAVERWKIALGGQVEIAPPEA